MQEGSATHEPSMSLETVTTPVELARRAARPPDYEAESRALADMMQVLAEGYADGEGCVDRILQALVDRALALCRADSAGISVLEEERGAEIFRWRAASGAWAKHLGESMERPPSPWGAVLARDEPMLVSYPEGPYRHAIDAPPVAEVLLIPFHHAGRAVGTLWIIAHDESRKFDREDERLMTSLSRFAALAYQLLAERRLSSEPRATQRLQEVSTRMVGEGDVAMLYDQILDAAVEIMAADFGSIQMVEQRQESSGLRLLASRGFGPRAASFWSWVGFDSAGSTCGAAHRRQRRVIAEDLENDPVIAGTADGAMFREIGARSCQSTPLISRAGNLVGMISTHWRRPHRPSDRDLRLLDVLGRQAADLIEGRNTQERLRDAHRRKDEFLAALAHELRNPLAPIMISLDLLDRVGGPSTLEIREAMRRQMNHLVRLVDDLLDVNRMTQNRLELRIERVDLGSIVRDALRAYEPSGRGPRHVDVQLPDEPLFFAGDHVRLVQAIGNLFNNAYKYTRPNGLISVSARREEVEVVVTVRDDGIGIAPSNRDKVFEMFYRGVPSESGGDGLGVGLTLARHLIELHGGSIDAMSEGLGKGSEFVVHLPLEQSMAESCENAPTPTRTTESISSRILVVDDNRDTAAGLTNLLNMSGAEAHMAHDGEAAVALAEKLRPDVVLLDIGLPKMNGYDACRAIRERLAANPPIMIALTGWGQQEDRRRSSEAGFDHHLTKPVSYEALAELLAR